MNLKGLDIDKGIVERAHFNPYHIPIGSGLARIVNVGGNPVISLGSNDYFGLANSKELKKAAKDAIDKFGVSMCGTAIVIGYTEVIKDLESKIANFLHQDNALVYPSGYQANLSVFYLLASRKDIIIADRFAHSSLIQGTQLSKAKLLRFPHNNMEKLEKFLKDSKEFGRRFIAVDGLYSTEGDIAPLDKIVELAEKYDAFTIVDDAHGLGVLGKSGRGSPEIFGVLDKVDMITGSLGKALGCAGGFIATNSKVADVFRYYSRPLVYSTALPSALVAPAIAAINIVEKADEKRKKLYKYKERLYEPLKEMDYKLTNSTTPVFSVISEEAEQIIKLTRDLYKEGIYAIPFIPPSVPEGRSCLRITPHTNLKEKDLEKVINVFRKLKGKYT